MWLAGFDPGGIDRFGWCVVEVSATLPMSLHSAGIASNAADAVRCVLEEIPQGSTLKAAGIDSPLFWPTHGDRNSDLVIRAEITRLGCQTAGGTVQHVNSLRGACLVQGVIVAKLLSEAIPEIKITEAHPKALLWLLGVATELNPVQTVTIHDLSDFVRSDINNLGEHERDACLAALGAWAMTYNVNDWRDLYLDENQPFVAVPPVTYWMPIIP